MASLESKAFILFLKLINKKSFLKKQFDFGKFDFYKCLEPPKTLRTKCKVETRTIRGRNVFTLTPKQNNSGKHILYLHGGAYVQNFVRQHWTFLGALAESLHCSITAPDYPLAPKHTYKDAFEMVVPLYKELIQTVHPANLIVMGDSAGGGFALALAQFMRTENLPQPAQLFLLSPWLDITMKNPAIQEIDPLDPFLGIEGLQKAGRLYAGNTDPDSYLLSPINGPLEGLAAVYLFIGTRDILVADARRLRALMRERSLPLHYYEYEDMIHVWMLLNFPESKKAREEIVGLIKSETTPHPSSSP